MNKEDIDAMVGQFEAGYGKNGEYVGRWGCYIEAVLQGEMFISSTLPRSFFCISSYIAPTRFFAVGKDILNNSELLEMIYIIHPKPFYIVPGLPEPGRGQYEVHTYYDGVIVPEDNLKFCICDRCGAGGVIPDGDREEITHHSGCYNGNDQHVDAKAIFEYANYAATIGMEGWDI